MFANHPRGQVDPEAVVVGGSHLCELVPFELYPEECEGNGTDDVSAAVCRRSFPAISDAFYACGIFSLPHL